MVKKNDKKDEMDIIRLQKGIFQVCVLGSTPLIFNRMAEKAKRQLLLPKEMSKAEKKSNLKHNPPQEFRDSAHRFSADDMPTRLFLPSTTFKKAMSSAAIDVPGATKAEIGRLVWVVGQSICIYGIPQLHMGIVRSADMNRTPDVRTRAIIGEWACRFQVSYSIPLLTERAVVNLLAAAGMIRGVGDWRVEKGSGDYGQFELVDEKDKRFLSIIKSGGRVAQDAAIKDPQPWDDESAELLTWYFDEVNDRGRKAVA